MRPMRLTPRLVFAAIFAASAGLLGFGYYLQEYVGLEPCPMCILQRYAFVAIGLIALLGAIHGPGRVATGVYAALIVLFAIGGGGTAMRHSYLQHFPPKMETCGTDLEFLLNAFPLSQAMPKIFAGTGSCSKVDWSFLGLTIPEWGLAWYVLLAGAALWIALRQKKNAA